MTLTWVDIIVALVFSGIGGTAGWFGALYGVAGDKRLVRVPEDCLIVKAEVFNKLQEIAEIKSKNNSIKFNSRGVKTGIKQEGDDEDGA